MAAATKLLSKRSARTRRPSHLNASDLQIQQEQHLMITFKCTHKFSSAVAIAAACFLASAPAQARTPAVNIGTLTCTVEPLPTGAKTRKHDLSCTFQPRNGPRASYAGSISIVAGARLLDANRVLIWTVLAPKGMEAHDIAGRYLTSLSSKPVPSAKRAGSMFRQESRTPVELRAQTLTKPGSSHQKLAIELELRAAKA